MTSLPSANSSSLTTTTTMAEQDPAAVASGPPPTSRVRRRHHHPPPLSVDTDQLRRVLRLVYCLQKERGASCAYYAGRGRDHSPILHNCTMDVARRDTDRALAAVVRQQSARTKSSSSSSSSSLAKTLQTIRNMIHPRRHHGSTSISENNNNNDHDIQRPKSGFHKILVCFNTLISSVVHDYILRIHASFQRKLQQQQQEQAQLNAATAAAAGQVDQEDAAASAAVAEATTTTPPSSSSTLGSSSSQQQQQHRTLHRSNTSSSTESLESKGGGNGGSSKVGGISRVLSHDDMGQLEKNSHQDPQKGEPTHRRLRSSDEVFHVRSSNHSVMSVISSCGSNETENYNTTTDVTNLALLQQASSASSPGSAASAAAGAMHDHHHPNAGSSRNHRLGRLFSLLDIFVRLKESTGVERATLSSILAQAAEQQQQEQAKSTVVTTSTAAAATNSSTPLLNDLVLQVENQRRLVDELSRLPAKGPLHNLVRDCVALSPEMRDLHNTILNKGGFSYNLQAKNTPFAKEKFGNAAALWDLLTCYIDKLHSLELLIVEEMECSGDDDDDAADHSDNDDGGLAASTAAAPPPDEGEGELGGGLQHTPVKTNKNAAVATATTPSSSRSKIPEPGTTTLADRSSQATTPESSNRSLDKVTAAAQSPQPLSSSALSSSSSSGLLMQLLGGSKHYGNTSLLPSPNKHHSSSSSSRTSDAQLAQRLIESMSPEEIKERLLQSMAKQQQQQQQGAKAPTRATAASTPKKALETMSEEEEGGNDERAQSLVKQQKQDDDNKEHADNDVGWSIGDEAGGDEHAGEDAAAREDAASGEDAAAGVDAAAGEDAASGEDAAASAENATGEEGATTSRVDNLLKELTSAPAMKEWEIDLYEIRFLKRIGQGTAGTTYLSEWSGLKVAVKVASISEMGLDGWRTEVQALQKLHHPNIIRLLGSVYHPQPLTFCLVLEYCNAGDLAQALKRVTPKNFVFHTAISIAKGMSYLHKKGIIHRDLKPANVLLEGNVAVGQFTVKVTDFGVATDLHRSAGDRTAETGTYRWMSPEVIRHEDYSQTADVYSFAVVLWQLLTRQDPFETKSQIEAAAAVALEQARPPFPELIPDPLRGLIEKCWHEEPSQRLDFDEICNQLTDMRESEKTLSIPEKQWLEVPLGHAVYNKKEKKTSSATTRVAQQTKTSNPNNTNNNSSGTTNSSNPKQAQPQITNNSSVPKAGNNNNNNNKKKGIRFMGRLTGGGGQHDKKKAARLERVKQNVDLLIDPRKANANANNKRPSFRLFARKSSYF